jgi:predicted RNase H-like HicB family nuclease
MVRDYHINVFWSPEDRCYVADIPDLKYCSAFGKSPLIALREVLKAKTAWLRSAKKSGVPVPKPRYRPAIYQAAS